MFATWWRTFKSSSNFRRTFLLAFYTAMILLRTVLNREIWFSYAHYMPEQKRNQLRKRKILFLMEDFTACIYMT